MRRGWLRGGGRRVSQHHHLEDANILSRVKLERLRPVIVNGNSRAPDHWRVLEYLSQKPAERR